MSMVATQVVETVRVCRACGVEKPIEEFSTTYLKWRLRTCKPCVSLQRKEHYQKHAETIIASSRAYYRGHRESAKRRCAIYYSEHREAICSQMREYHRKHGSEYYQKHQETRRQQTRDYYAAHRAENLRLYGIPTLPRHAEQIRKRTSEARTRNRRVYGTAKAPYELEQQKQNYIRLRTKALEYYGGKCECCGENRYDTLTFDHIEGNGHKSGIRGVRLVYDSIREYEESGYPNNKYRILCWNCNTSRGFYRYCPHEGYVKWDINRGRRLKTEVIEAYGGQCAFCGESHPEFLTIDHINGGGVQHRASLGNGVTTIYVWLKRQSWPKDEYRLLCANCNCSVKRNKWSRGG
ncbi:hypothetical protein LCGC14_0539870 [marine sediment metagenome]|uniref:HNH nuclease domain-containing protein n=1 Tax=marine sediment metagenome TaxID=412755 RepID=A0A0F9RT83_9ZZZZ